jgi:hypothetical protein
VRGGGQAVFGGEEQCDAAGLRGAHHRAAVLLGEHPLDGDHVGRCVASTSRRPAAMRARRSAIGKLGARADHAHECRRRRPVGAHVDDADAAPGQAGSMPRNAQRMPLTPR